MYSFTTKFGSELILFLNYAIYIRPKKVAKNVSRAQIKRFKHENNIRIYKCGHQTKVII